MQQRAAAVATPGFYRSSTDDLPEVWRGRAEGLSALEHLSAFYRTTPRNASDEVLITLRGARTVERSEGVTVATLKQPEYLSQIVLDLHHEYYARLNRFPPKDSSASRNVRDLVIETPTDVLTLSTRTPVHMWHATADLYGLETDDPAALPFLVGLVGEVVENRSILDGRDVTRH